MCRLAAYLGPAISLDRLLLDPPHSLQVQAAAPREMVYASHNADGFGFGWFTDDHRPARYRNTLPIWNDANLTDLAASLRRPVWLAIVRAATPGLGLSLANTGPYAGDGLLCMHNGFVRDFAASLRTRLQCELDPQIGAEIQGNTDSEYLFALVRQSLRGRAGGDPLAALAAAVDWLEATVEVETLLNLVLSDGHAVYACRHGINGACPSLYYCDDDPAFPAGAQLLASEPLSPGTHWRRVPDHSLIRLTPGEAASIEPL